MDLRPQPGPQEQALTSPADIVIYGGAAGGGKTYSILLEVCRHLDNEGFGGVIFRRTGPQLTGSGSLWEEGKKLFFPLGCELRQSPNLSVRFPAGGLLQLMHLQYEDDVESHQGKEYALICFDELSHFEESQFWYMVSRLRSTAGIDPYIRCTTNPDPDSFIRELIAWWIGDPDCPECQASKCDLVEHGYPIPERSGVIRWFFRVDEDLKWADTEEECEEYIREAGYEVGEDIFPISFTFIEAKLEDNPALTEKDPRYKSKLMAMPKVKRLQLLGGNWNARAGAGEYIEEGHVTKRWPMPENAQGLDGLDLLKHLPPLNIFIASDYAVTEKKLRKQPDYTEHGVFGLDSDDNLWVLDWWYGQTKSDVWITALLDLYAKWQPSKCFAEKGQIINAVGPLLALMQKERKLYFTCTPISGPASEDGEKEVGYKDSSKRAKAKKARSFQGRASIGKIWWHPSAPWVARVTRQIVGFPKERFDDAFDVCANLCMGLDQMHAPRPPKEKTSAPRDKYAKAFRANKRPKTGLRRFR